MHMLIMCAKTLSHRNKEKNVLPVWRMQQTKAYKINPQNCLVILLDKFGNDILNSYSYIIIPFLNVIEIETCFKTT